MSEVFYQTKVNPELKKYKKFKKEMDKRIEKEGLQKCFESVRDNKDLFDREYYMKSLEEKGFRF
jgi:hypothetical protein